MRIGLPALLAGLAGLVTMIFGATAFAGEPITIDPDQVPVTAVDFATHGCTRDPAAEPLPGEDVWVFALPEGTGDFLTVTATFEDPAGVEHTVEGAVPPLPETGTALVRSPLGWTLTGATATVSGTVAGKRFTLVETCPGVKRDDPAGSGSPSASSSASSSASPSASSPAASSPSSSPSRTPSKSPSQSASPSSKPASSAASSSSSSAKPSSSAVKSSSKGARLPTTGASLPLVATVGVVLVIGGLVLVLALRRKRS